METTKSNSKAEMQNAINLITGDHCTVADFREQLIQIYRNYSMNYIRLESSECKGVEPSCSSDAAADDLFMLDLMISNIQKIDKE